MNLKRLQKSNQRGFTLIEMIVYIAVLFFVSVGSITIIFSLQDLFAKYRTEQLIFRSANTALEKILLDIRDSSSVATSSYGNPGHITLTGSGGTKAYSLSNGAVRLSENGSDIGALTEDGVTATELRFYTYSSTTDLVRVKLTLSATLGDTTQTRTFNAGAVLFESYE